MEREHIGAILAVLIPMLLGYLFARYSPFKTHLKFGIILGVYLLYVVYPVLPLVFQDSSGSEHLLAGLYLRAMWSLLFVLVLPFLGCLFGVGMRSEALGPRKTARPKR